MTYLCPGALGPCHHTVPVCPLFVAEIGSIRGFQPVTLDPKGRVAGPCSTSPPSSKREARRRELWLVPLLVSIPCGACGGWGPDPKSG